jgi:prepilin peptidase CpaA
MSVSFTAALIVASAACVTDLSSRRIPNALTFSAAAAGVAYHVFDDGGSGALFALVGLLVGIAVFLLPFALGGLGGGDVKLLGALGAWLGASGVFWVAIYTGIAGGVLALAVSFHHGYLRTALSNIRLLLMHWRLTGVRPLGEVTLETSKGPKLAYAVPILMGTVVTTWLRS